MEQNRLKNVSVILPSKEKYCLTILVFYCMNVYHEVVVIQLGGLVPL